MSSRGAHSVATSVAPAKSSEATSAFRIPSAMFEASCRTRSRRPSNIGISPSISHMRASATVAATGLNVLRDSIIQGKCVRPLRWSSAGASVVAVLRPGADSPVVASGPTTSIGAGHRSLLGRAIDPVGAGHRSCWGGPSVAGQPSAANRQSRPAIPPAHPPNRSTHRAIPPRGLGSEQAAAPHPHRLHDPHGRLPGGRRESGWLPTGRRGLRTWTGEYGSWYMGDMGL